MSQKDTRPAPIGAKRIRMLPSEGRPDVDVVADLLLPALAERVESPQREATASGRSK